MKSKNKSIEKKLKGRSDFMKIKILFFLILLGMAVYFETLIITDQIKNQQERGKYEHLQQKKKKKGVRKLHQKYKDMIGWLEIKNTEFSYPVMQTKLDVQYYLHRDVNGDYSFYGTPFLDSRCLIDSDNRIIYGHNINGRRFFGFIQNYREESFYKKYPDFYFTKVDDTEKKYEIVSVIKTDIKSRCYEFTDSYNDEEYRSYVRNIINSSMYSCKVTELVKKEMREKTVEAFFHQYQFITLSTCRTGEGRDARLLVIGCRRNESKEVHTE